jgi:hypothetical protein
MDLTKEQESIILDELHLTSGLLELSSPKKERTQI